MEFSAIFYWGRSAGCGAGVLLLVLGLGACKGGDKKDGQKRYADVSYESKDSRREVSLPDGSTVMLFPHSVIRVGKAFNTGDRDLELDGEALFNVKADAGKPFIVHTRNLNILVLGTRFHADAFAANAGEEVDLLSGKLKVTKTYHSTTDNEPELLQDGEMVMINRDIDLMEKEKLKPEELAALEAKLKGETAVPADK